MLRSLCFCALLLPGLGCFDSQKFGTVTGKVTLDEVVLTDGKISFLSMQGGEAVTVPINPDGTYRAEKVPVGEVVVSLQDNVDPAVLAEEKMTMKRFGQRVENNPALAQDPTAIPPATPRKTKIPTAYSDPSTAGLTVVVKNSRKEGETTFDVPLSSKKIVQHPQ